MNNPSILLISFAGFIVSCALVLLTVYFVYLYSKSKRAKKPFILDFMHSRQLGPYYMSLKEKLDPQWQAQFKRGGNGEFLSYDLSSKTWYANPIANCHQALAFYERYMENQDEQDLMQFMTIVEAIEKAGVRRDDGCFVFEYPTKSYEGQKTPWLSAMGQGQLLLVFARAYQETEDNRYYELCTMALKPFTLEIHEGGVRHTDADRGVFYEEYAFWETNKQHHTLNGMMSALMGVHDFWKVGQDATAHEIFNCGIDTLKNNLAAYELSFSTTYDLRHEHGEKMNIATGHYHSVHVSHLQILHALTNDVYFNTKAVEWDQLLVSSADRLQLAYHRLIARYFYMLMEMKHYGGWLGYLKYEFQRFALKARVG